MTPKLEEIQLKVARQADTPFNPRVFHKVNNLFGACGDMPNNDVASALHGLIERVYCVELKGEFQRPPLPCPELGRSAEAAVERRKTFGQRSLPFQTAFKRSFNRLYSGERVSPATLPEFLGKYGGAQLKRYTQAAKSFDIEPFSKSDAKISMFTKDEHRDWKYSETLGKWVPKPPRAIQTRSPRYHVAIGTYLDPIEERIYAILDDMFADGPHPTRTVAKGMNLNQRGETIKAKWDKFSDPVAIGLDAARYDQHQHVDLLHEEHKVYRMMVDGESPEPSVPPLEELLAQQLWNKGKYKSKTGTIKYSVVGCRMSGDKNTSLGNIINMLHLMFRYLKLEMKARFELLNDGDDNVLIVERKDLQRIKDTIQPWFLEQGITMKIEGIFNELEEIEFCQTHPVEINGKYKLVPNPHKRLYSDLMTTKQIATAKPYAKWLGAVAGCGAAASEGVPIAQAYYQWVATGAKPYMPREGTHYYRYRDELVAGMIPRCSEVSLENRISYFWAYGITPQDQVLIEQSFDTMPPPVWAGKPMYQEKSEVPLALRFVCPPKWDKTASPNMNLVDAQQHMRDVVFGLVND
jgi:hypothetical protein